MTRVKRPTAPLQALDGTGSSHSANAAVRTMEPRDCERNTEATISTDAPEPWDSIDTLICVCNLCVCNCVCGLCVICGGDFVSVYECVCATKAAKSIQSYEAR